MKPAAFDYAAPRTLAECLALKSRYGEDARFIAGGQSLMPLLSLRIVRPAVVIDLRLLSELAAWRREGDTIAIGAMLRQNALERDAALAAALPLLAEAVPQIGHPATRSRGTIVGSLCHADPAAELPVCALLLEAQIVLGSASGNRTLPVASFIADALSTTVRADELALEVRFPAAKPGTGYAFLELARRHGDFALISVAAMAGVADGAIAGARVALGGLGSAPMVVDLPQLDGTRADDAAATAAAALAVAAATEPATDLHATAAYRRSLAGVLVERALARAVANAGTRSAR